ncbi:hypothetical protein prwr041_23330 [Prevotella herbatica]|uniref:IrrE N-terminal-like domain-containing protein n=1 Tax=Prevotella herbatica TaxID=2801997 RepID=A0ABM7P104_9BACT|nr:phage exclusion protein Lit family protein [Prevotella herbatica]BCS86440.1 hypothetical protein prwr041_23330 [Prevotella herbatica]
MKDTINSPVSWLFKYILGRLENTNPDYIDRVIMPLVDDCKLNTGIVIDQSKAGKFRAYVNSEGKITITENFLCYIWNLCYFGLVSYEEGVASYWDNKQKGIKEDNINHIALRVAEECRQYAMSLHWGYDEWPENLPKPNNHDKNEAVNFTNQLFLYAVNYILCHEIAHILLGHSVGVSSERFFEQEYEADEMAFQEVLKGRYGKNNLTVELGVLMGFCAMIMASPSDKDGITHPSSLKRLKSFIDFVSPAPDPDLECSLSISRCMGFCIS